MQRTDLIKSLDRIKPALSTSDLIPAMKHFWFNKQDVMAYNDRVAFRTKCLTEFEGAVQGKILLDLLSKLRAKSLVFEPGKNDVSIRAATKSYKSNFKLKTLSTDEISFEMPEPTGKVLDIDNKDLIKALDVCMLSAGVETLVPSRYHFTITVVPGDDELTLFSTDDVTISTATLPIKKKVPFKEPITLHASFCTQALALLKSKTECHIEFHDDYALVYNDESLLFGRLVDLDSPIDFPSVVERHFSDEDFNNLIPIPKQLPIATERAKIVSGQRMDWVATKLTIKDKSISLRTKSELGSVSDTLKTKYDHDDVTTAFEARLLSRGFDTFDKFVVTETAIVMAEPGAAYLVNTIRG